MQAQLARVDRNALGELGDMTFQERREYHQALGRKVRPAGVLILLIQRGEALNVVLTQRTAHLHDHAGQISFPGGKQEAGETFRETALRETQEEQDPRLVSQARNHQRAADGRKDRATSPSD